MSTTDKKNRGRIRDPQAAEFVAEAPKTSRVPKERQRLTVDIPVPTYKALGYAKVETGLDLLDLVAEALAAYEPVAKHLRRDK
ncbi:hypothetical protein [Nocardia paucivorans]|uniref:hypothetical protein n=1 Tax=Nocardia paucivorans TaxID=114259 RepID=UPI0002FF20F8|nr:hypothetical protein [Nocardia paucivorans]